jgi:hypothetical protein
MTRREEQAGQAHHGKAQAPEDVDHAMLATGHADRERNQHHDERRR